jgi:putative DNA primase/helicase
MSDDEKGRAAPLEASPSSSTPQEDIKLPPTLAGNPYLGKSREELTRILMEMGPDGVDHEALRAAWAVAGGGAAVVKVEAELAPDVRESMGKVITPGGPHDLTKEDEDREMERLKADDERRKEEVRVLRICADLTGSDDGNALRLVEWYGKDLRYDHTGKRWLIWDGIRWRPDEEGSIVEMAREVARRIPEEARYLHEQEAGARLKWAGQSLEAHRLANMLKLAQSDRQVAITGKVLDINPLLMGLPNGTLDLKTGGLHPPRKEDLITRITTAPFIPGAPCPTWVDHIRRVGHGDPEFIKYLQVVLGYSLLGTNPEAIFNIVWGKGKNGKSVTFRAVGEVLGDYATVADPSTFEAQKYEKETRDDLVQLRGARLVTSFETQKGRRLAENFIKAMTGGDVLKKRGLYAKPETFTLPAKVFLCSNYKPRVRDFTIGWWERLKMLPFLHYFPPEERDPGIDEKLRKEGPGILQWLLAGLKEYLARGFPPCRAVDAAVKEFKETQEGDVGQWLHEVCAEEEEAAITRKNARLGFLDWCKAGDEEKEAMANKDFLQELRDRGFGEKVLHGTYYWVGFRFKTNDELGRQATLVTDEVG